MPSKGNKKQDEVDALKEITTKRAKSKAKKAEETTSPLPQSEEEEGVESDSEDSHIDDAEEGNNDAK
ncbi:hypothetical protein HAX54_001967 [Datura stramonium]|uniref:Uncharacterized protein n=1 Tax=Datura stramonium TaxID=4076 RepID=A0ABS8T488_DATST|nr:hypothetical protein [Datura stramonium]